MKLLIEWVYKTPTGIETVFQSARMDAQQALLLAEDLEKTGRTKKMTLSDEYDSNWTIKELKRYFKNRETEPHHITVYFDGGFDLATHKSGLGCVIYYEQNGNKYRLRKNAPVQELTSNNEAEYASLYLGIQELHYLNVHHLNVHFIGDSQVVINQLNGEWPVYEKTLSDWADRVEKKLQKLGIKPTYELIQRNDNKEADRLATQALNNIQITATSELTKK